MARPHIGPQREQFRLHPSSTQDEWEAQVSSFPPGGVIRTVSFCEERQGRMPPAYFRKRFGGDRAGFELTIGADADLAAKRPGW
jgi:hypothetical protein